MQAIKILLALFIKYLVVGIFMSLIIFALFQSPIFSSAVLFYRGIVILAIASSVCFLTIYCAKGIKIFEKSTFVQSFSLESSVSVVVTVAMVNLTFFILVPVTIDRSVSTFMLSRMATPSSSYDKASLRTLLVDEYIDRYDAVGRRIDEQKKSRNIVEKDGKYVLSEQGRSFLTFAQLVTKLYAIDDRYVSQENRE